MDYKKYFKRFKINCDKTLDEYIDFCLRNDYVGDKTELHHILPRAQFPEFIDIGENSWNGSNLTPSNHLIAHYMLSKAVIECSGGLTALHSLRRRVCDINEIEYNNQVREAYKNNGLKASKTKNKVLFLDDGTKTTSAKEGGRKAALTKNIEFINKKGELTTIAKESGKKNSILSKKLVTADDGSLITKARQTALKGANTMKSPIMLEDGSVTSILKESRKKNRLSYKQKGKFFNVFHIDRGIVESNVWSQEIREKYIGSLLNNTRDKYAGKSERAKTRLKNLGREHIIGLYVEEIKK